VTGGKGSTQLVSKCGAVLGSGEGRSEYNALSADGETIFFSTSAHCSAGEKNVYARLHGSVVSSQAAETVDVSESECTAACGGESGKNFEGASEDGHEVFFTSTQKLTNGAVDETAGGTDNAVEGACAAEGSLGCNLYEYDFGLPEHARLRVLASGVLGVGGIAQDGSEVYFVAKGRLTEEPRGGAGGPCLRELGKVALEEEELTREGRCRAKREADNLYAYNTNAGSVAYVTTLTGGDGEDWRQAFRRPVEVTGEPGQEGQFLLFASGTPGLTEGDVSPAGLTQLFEYDAQTEELVRVTQGENGYNNNGNNATNGAKEENPVLQGLVGLADNEHTGFRAEGNRLNVSRDGGTVVFETAGKLSPLAVSADVGCTSVYEFRSSGGVLSDGRVRLLSDGRDVLADKGSACGAQFLEMDWSGGNVLFATADPLLTGDVDGVQRDIYDAREGGGFPPGPASTPECKGAGCLGSFSSPPGPASPGSLSQTPEAPVSAPATASTPKIGTKKTTSKCAKGKKLSHGKCVKNKTNKAKQASLDRRVK
jgi:hypothetical protein